jgi:2-keto-4-pentenoate hydratase/2-oxohepta-3-ene-1,7-dioic acid hydratase in catechol pathway
LRLISFRTASGAEALGVATADRWLPATAVSPDGPATIGTLLALGPDGVRALEAAVDPGRIEREGRLLGEAELLAPVPHPGKVVAIGRNYREHAAEEGVDPPPAPLIFAKWPSSVVGPGAEIRWDPAHTAKVDYEAELAVVIGRAPAASPRRTPSTASSATRASTTSRRATSSSATASGSGASRSTRSARWARSS